MWALIQFMIELGRTVERIKSLWLYSILCCIFYTSSILRTSSFCSCLIFSNQILDPQPSRKQDVCAGAGQEWKIWTSLEINFPPKNSSELFLTSLHLNLCSAAMITLSSNKFWLLFIRSILGWTDRLTSRGFKEHLCLV